MTTKINCAVVIQRVKLEAWICVACHRDESIAVNRAGLLLAELVEYFKYGIAHKAPRPEPLFSHFLRC
jgi:hypothetical protein